ncbi:MAG TPA: glycosyltransferase [Phycisphaerae bacterium]|nr:glycosyltransferase [Phycisphaerae bacterium]HRW53912.1 glycosyltransferase [Phycisphaerae bacterium]
MNELAGKHIVIVPAWWPSPEQPQAGIFFQDYVAAFSAAGATVGVIYPDLVGLRHWGRGERKPIFPRITHEESTAAAPVVRIRGLQSSFGSVARQARRTRDWLARGLRAYRDRVGEPDLLHAMCAVPTAWACANLDDPLAKRVVLTEHTGPFSLVMQSDESSALARGAFRAVVSRVAVSDHLRRQIVAAGIDDSIEVIGNPVSDMFTPADAGDRSPSDRVRALYVGRLTREKGIPMLVGAIESALDVAKACEFHIVGDGPLGVTLAPFEHDPERRVTRHAACPRAEVVSHMRRADFLVHPTLGETFGMTVAEALCTGLPVVTTRGVACAEFIDDDNGILVEPGDERALAAGLKQMIARHRDYDRAAIAARARSRFSGAAVAAAYRDPYERAIVAR